MESLVLEMIALRLISQVGVICHGGGLDLEWWEADAQRRGLFVLRRAGHTELFA